MNIDPVILSVITMAVTGAAAFGGVKVGLNGAKNDIREVKIEVKGVNKKLDTHIHDEGEFQDSVIDRLARIETELET